REPGRNPHSAVQAKHPSISPGLHPAFGALFLRRPFGEQGDRIRGLLDTRTGRRRGFPSPGGRDHLLGDLQANHRGAGYFQPCLQRNSHRQSHEFFLAGEFSAVALRHRKHRDRHRKRSGPGHDPFRGREAQGSPGLPFFIERRTGMKNLVLALVLVAAPYVAFATESPDTEMKNYQKSIYDAFRDFPDKPQAGSLSSGSYNSSSRGKKGSDPFTTANVNK